MVYNRRQEIEATDKNPCTIWRQGAQISEKTYFLAEILRYQLRSRKRVAVIRTRNATWSTKAESLAENAKPSIRARHRPSITKDDFNVFHVGRWDPINKSSVIFVPLTNHQYLAVNTYAYKKNRAQERERVLTLTPGARAPRKTAFADDMPSPTVFLVSIRGIEISSCRIKERQRQRRRRIETDRVEMVSRSSGSTPRSVKKEKKI